MDFSYQPNNLPSVNPLYFSNPPPMGQVLTVVGGRVVASSQGQFPINGQQLMMQLDSLTCAMTDMTVTTEEEMEETTNQTEQEMLQQKLYQQQQQLLQQQQQQVEHLRQPTKLSRRFFNRNCTNSSSNFFSNNSSRWSI